MSVRRDAERSEPTANLARVRTQLSGLPPHLRVFDRLVHRLSSRPDVSLAVSGSLAKGSVDQWSDLDIEIIAHEEGATSQVQKWVKEQSATVAPLMTQFPADHVDLDEILVSFFLEDGVVIKADLFTLGIPRFLGIKGTLLIRDPADTVGRAAGTTSPEPKTAPDHADLDRKLCGWLWYTHSKIQRGEYLEAVNALEMMRSYALVPMLRALDGLPDEGFRRLETQLRPDYLARLIETIPRGPAAPALRYALLALGRFYIEVRPLMVERLRLHADDSSLRQMLGFVERGTGVLGASSA